jgi:dual specificity phosphatase 12
MGIEDPNRYERCRILVIGSHRNRVNKVISLLLPQAKFDPVPSSIDFRIEYLPCVASFSSYSDDSEAVVRYLENVQYFPHDSLGTLSLTPSSLVPFFDDAIERLDSPFPPISGVVVGCGIEGPEDTARINDFFKMMSSGIAIKNRWSIKVKTIEPNHGFKCMGEELSFYKQLSPEESEEVNRLQTMGPQKMVKFIINFTNDLVQESLGQYRRTDMSLDNQAHPIVDSVDRSPRKINPMENRYLCRICRMILFGEADLQDPPHQPSRHQFSYRKIHHGAVVTSSLSECCQSYFLQDCLEWMGDDFRNGVPEGKLSCPKCDGKVGAWTWSGAQCSCGTWVVPAIQIPRSKVDVLPSSVDTESTIVPIA